MSRADLPAILVDHGEHDGAVPSSGAATTRAVEQEEDAFSPYRLVHHYLRGRYLVAIGLGLLLAAGFAVVGWHATKPVYRSEALIRISYEQPRVLQANSDYRPMEVFEAFMQSQVAMIQSHRVLSKALEERIWQEKNIKIGPSAIDGFAEDLIIEHRAGTEHLKIAFSSDNAVFAATAVRAAVNAYVADYESMDKQTNTEKTSALETRKDELNAKLDKLDAALRTEAAEFGSSNVDRFYDAAVQRLTRVESALIDVRIALAMTQTSKGGVARFSPQQLARFDPTMARYMADREALEMQLEQLRMRGYGEEHKQVVQARKMLDLVTQRMKDYAVDFQLSGQAVSAPAVAPNAGVAGTPGLVGRSSDELKADESNLTELNKGVKDQLAALGAKKLKIESMRSEIDKTRGELSEVTTKLTSMQIESGISGRLMVMSNGEVATKPFRDRRMHLAAAGAAGGMCLPALALIGIGMANRKYRYSMDAADDLSKDLPLLGILPQLPARLTDADSAADAAQCLHQIRVMLQVHHPGHGPVAYLLTSSCPGEGKTSLCAALALSFAAAGARTLVVDSDLIGQRLTRGYRMDDRPGFREAMVPGRKSVSYYPSGIHNLSILPAGVSDGRDACSVSSKMVKRLLTSMREQFDVILLDSGPILGSLEALVVAQHADGVILTISREQQKPLVDRAVRQLRSVRAKITGMVFNKAESADFKRSVGASSLRSIPRNPESSSMVKAGMTSTSGFGSLVDSVQTFMPAPATV